MLQYLIYILQKYEKNDKLIYNLKLGGNTVEVKEGEIYRHFKGPFYYVICVGFDSETQERVVVYRHLDNSGKICTRKESMFL